MFAKLFYGKLFIRAFFSTIIISTTSLMSFMNKNQLLSVNMTQEFFFLFF
jgi:hypothetical protein